MRHPTRTLRLRTVSGVKLPPDEAVVRKSGNPTLPDLPALGLKVRRNGLAAGAAIQVRNGLVHTRKVHRVVELGLRFRLCSKDFPKQFLVNLDRTRHPPAIGLIVGKGAKSRIYFHARINLLRRIELKLAQTNERRIQPLLGLRLTTEPPKRIGGADQCPHLPSARSWTVC